MKYYPPRYLFRRYEVLRALNPGNNFMEIGPGNMELSKELLNFFYKGTIIDFSQSSKSVYNRLPASIRQKLEFKKTDFMLTSIPSTYDCVIACEVLEHIEHESKFLERIYDCLVLGGQVIISVPARMKFWSKHDELVGHLRRYEKESLQKLFHDNNFCNVHVISYGFPFINILRLPRIVLAQWKKHNIKSKSIFEKTAWSGVQQTAGAPRWVGVLCNPYTVYPLSRLAAMFNRTDWSDGFLVTAIKSK